MMVRPPCSDKLNIRKGIWKKEDDVDMLSYVSKQGTGIRRCGKSSRGVRRTNTAKNNEVGHESFTLQEEELIIRLHAAIGSRWPIISQQLPGRTDNDVKNYWNTKLKKKLSSMGIDPVTHRPFSQMLADYGNISGITRTKPRIGCLDNQDAKTAIFVPKPIIPPVEKCRTFPVNFDNNMSSNTIKTEATEMKTDSLDLLTQLQAITLIKDSSIPPLPQFYCAEFSSLPSSSTSSSTKSVHNFDWREFLLENVHGQGTERDKEDGNEEGKRGFDEGFGCTISSSISKDGETETCDESFVEAMLDGGNDMLLDFPGLLGEPFYYL